VRFVPWLVLAACALPLAACPEPPVFNRREQVDVFVQETRRAVDILLVVDNSCSMIDEQIKLGASFDRFIEQFVDAEVDYQIGVVTTDMVDPAQSGRLVGDTKLITSEIPIDEARTLFEANTHVCATGSGFERGLAAAKAAFSDDILGGENAGLLREEAALAVIFVSDEEDLSAEPVGAYLDFFYGLKGEPRYRDREMFSASAVVGDLPDGCTQPEPDRRDCTGATDDDEDGLFGCDDPDCASAWLCQVDLSGEFDCGDGEDGDGDGAIDCQDADCGHLNSCRETECTDGEDDDGDGLTDCADLDCLVGQPQDCGEVDCFDGQFEHWNGFLNAEIDCDDPSCFTAPDFAEICLSGRAEIAYPELCSETVFFDPLTGRPGGVDGRDVDDASSLDDELAGCDDPDCATYALCNPQIEAEPHATCGDCVDDDGDGLEDCKDWDCLDSEYCDNPYDITPGSRYADVALRTGGLVTSICAEDFSPLVRELGLNISGLRTEFFLTAWPTISEGVDVRYGSQDAPQVTEGWQYDPDQNRIVFDDESLPPSGTTLYVHYQRSTVPPSEQTE
jgi:hypothetical protein